MFVHTARNHPKVKIYRPTLKASKQKWTKVNDYKTEISKAELFQRHRTARA